MQKYCISLFVSVIGMKSIVFAAKSLVMYNGSRSAAQEQWEARNRDFGKGVC